MLKKYRKDSDGSIIKVKPTEIAITDNYALKTAEDMIDLSIMQIEKDRAELLELRREKRRNNKKSK